MSQSLSIHNTNPKILEGPEYLHHLIDWKLHGDLCALDFQSENGSRHKYTYNELHSRVSSFAENIQKLLEELSIDESEQQIIPILLPQCPALYVAILAILETGAAYCPINLDSPLERIKFVVEDVQASVLITTKTLKDSVTWSGGPKVLVIDDIPRGLDHANTASLNPRPGSLAYVMYTSGSTGKPKGVSLPHHAVTQSLLAHDRQIPPFKRFLQFAAPSFDVSQFEIMFPLFRGATLVACHRPRLLNGLVDVMNEMDVDAAELTPTVAGSLLQRRSNVPKLKILLTIGEMLTRPVVDEFGGSEAKESMLYGMYGPTEAAIHCTINPRMKAGSKVANIGFGFETVSTFIIAITEESEAGVPAPKLLPKMEVGELVLGGPQLARGYLNRPEQNKVAFIVVEGQPAYRTGDKARMLEDGSLEIQGRISSGQVKIRGQRAELGEIEEAVYKHDNIKMAVASVVDGVLVVFILEKETGTDIKDVLRVCKKWLPKYMIPNEILPLQEFPHLPSGKVDKKALDKDYRERMVEDVAHDEDEQTATETKIAGILNDSCGIRVRATDKLAAHGLDSLLAIRVASDLRSAGYNITVLDLLQAETLRVLSKECTEKATPHMNEVIEPSASQVLTGLVSERLDEDQSREIHNVYPASPTQDAMLTETIKSGLAYWNRLQVRIDGARDNQSVQQAVVELALANPILRTGFVHCPNDDSTFVQVTWKALLPAQLTCHARSNQSCETKAQDMSLLHPINIDIQSNEDSTDLSIIIHHAVYDGWALELLLDDLQSLVNGDTLNSRPSFNRVVKAAIDQGKTDSKARHLSYWKDHLAQFPAQDLPNFNTVTDVSSELHISSKVTAISTNDLVSAAKALEASPQAILQAAFSILLSSYHATQDIAFGTVFSGRTDAVDGIDEIIGPCLSTLPIRVDLETTFNGFDLIRQLHNLNRAHLLHSSIPLRNIIQLSDTVPGRSLFDCLLVWQQTLHPIEYRRESVALINSRDYLEFALTLEIIPTQHTIHLKANYDVSRLPHEQIDHLLGQLENITALLIKSPKTALDQSLSTIGDIHLSIDNAEPAVHIESGSVFQTIEILAKTDPDRIAVEFASKIEAECATTNTLSYKNLNLRANQLAHRLIDAGSRQDALVCICLEKSLDLYSSILATVKSGAGYLPVTPDTPIDRIAYIIQESRTGIVITHSSLASKFATLKNIRVLNVDEPGPIDFDQNPGIVTGHDAVAYCIFTSGSTGKPKGVVINVGNLLSNLEVLSMIYPHASTSRLLQSCSQAFDVSVFEIFWTWHVGASLCVATKDVLFRDIEMTIRAFGATHLSMTPTVAALVNPANVPTVELLITAGEAVTTKVFNAWADRGLYQGYGPSETTNICTVRSRVRKNDYINNIGQGFSNTSTFVLAPTEQFCILPLGGEGEFCFGGAQVGRGYLDTRQSEGKFIQHPRYGKLYRSGDFGRMLPDKSLSFTGRKDDQVKVRGLRIELGEINSTVLDSERVRDCITLVVDDANQEAQRLICFWVPAKTSSSQFELLQPTDFSTTITQLFADITAALPSYMLPNNLVPVSSLPQTSNYGKVDKKRLLESYRSLDVSYLNVTSQSHDPTTEHEWTQTERSVAKAVSKVAKTDQAAILPNASFYSMGIDSVSAISLANELRKIGITVEISQILRNSSVNQLAAVIEASDDSKFTATKSADVSFDLPEDFVNTVMRDFADRNIEATAITPCTPLQEAMLSASLGSARSAYSNFTLLSLNVTRCDIETAWSLMVQRHEILRTCFKATEMTDFPFVQVVLKKYDSCVDIIETDDLATTLSSLQGQGLDPFTYVPPVKITFVSSGKHLYLLISMHHSLYDGYALSILYEEMEKSMRGQGLSDPVSFGPFLQTMGSVDMKACDQYWAGVLHNFKPVPLTFQTRTEEQASHIQIRRLDIKLSRIETSVRDLNTSLLAICQTVLSSLLSVWQKTSDVCFGNIVSGRTLPVPEIDRLVAPCFNTIPVRIKKTTGLTLLASLRTLEAQNLDGLPYQMTPLRRIQGQNTDNGARLFETLLLLQPPTRDLDGDLWTLEEDHGAMDLPVVVEIIPKPTDDHIEVMLHSAKDTLTKREALEFLSLFDEHFSKVVGNPRQQLLNSTVQAEIEAIETQRQVTEHKQVQSEEANSEPMNAVESTIRDAFAKFSPVSPDKIQLDTTIYRLGLDSINAVQIATVLRDQSFKVQAADILEHPTVRDLAFLCSNGNRLKNEALPIFDFATFDNRHRQDVSKRLGIQPDHIEAIRPCTSVQSGMLAQTLHSGGRDYVNCLTMNIDPSVQLQDLQAAWRSVFLSTEMLRTRFIQVDDAHYRFAMLTLRAQSADFPWYLHEDDNDIVPASLDFSNSVEGQAWRIDAKVNGPLTIRFSAHHALYDARSLQIILSDVAAVLRASNAGPSVLQPIEPLVGIILVSNSDKDLSGKSRDFWTRQNKIYVNKFPDLTPLRVASEKSIVVTSQSMLSSQQVDELCRQQEVSVQAAAQASWARMLAFYTGEPVTTFGITLSGRSILDGADSIAFPSIVTIPASIMVTGTNRQLLQTSMTFSARAQKHQFTPLTTIQKLSDHPEGKMFDTLFAYQRTSSSDNDIGGPWKIVDEKAAVDYAISIEFEPQVDGNLLLRMTAKENLIPFEQAKFMLVQLDAVFRDILEHPDKPCTSTNLPGTDGLLSRNSAKQDELTSKIKLLHEFVEDQARTIPDKIALEFVTELEPCISQTWTFSELNREGNRVAQLIQKQNVTQGDLIAISFDKCPQASFAILGALKAGCGYVALDPNAPIERVKFIMKDAASSLVLSAGKAYRNLLQGDLSEDIRVVDLDSADARNYDGAGVHLVRAINPQDTSYCLYTSGTTGTPKGCILTHENAVQAMLAFQHLYGGTWHEESRWLTVASWHFDVSVMEQYWTWSVGIRLVCAPRDLIFEDIPGTIDKLKITHIDLTPSLARLVLPDEVPSLWNGVFLTGGEQLKQEILDVWGDKHCIYNAYGPTEATIGCTMYRNVPENGKPANIGLAYPNVGTIVVKPGTEEPVFRGGLGELCVSGKLVAKGYLNREELTTKCFPYFEELSDRVYRTGDLVRLLHDNTFLFIGRADDQVKLRGQRIQLSEGNEVMKKYVDGIDEVVTLVLKHAKQQKEQLVTFFVPKPGEKEVESLIQPMRDACKAHLPPYMVPTHIIPLKSIPLSPNSKADSKQLARLYDEYTVEELQKLGADNKPTRQWTNKDRSVLRALSRALGVDERDLTPSVTIFELGVDSISVIGLIRSLQNAGYKNAQLSVVMKNSSIGNLVDVLAGKSGADSKTRSSYISAVQRITAFAHKHRVGVADDLQIDASKIESLAPCTPAQEGMIYRFLDSDENLYFNTFEFQLSEAVDLDRLKGAWAEVMRNVQVLRTAFALTSDGCAQVVLHKDHINIDDYIRSPRTEKTDILQHPWNIDFVPMGGDKSATSMILTILHTLYDGMSLPTLMSKVHSEYISHKDVSYGPQFQAVLPHGPLACPEGAEQFWRDALDGLQYTQLPELSSYTEKNAHATRHVKDLGYLEKLRQNLGVTYQAVLQAAWCSVLQEKLSSLVSFGLVLSGRSIDFENVENVIGPLLNTVVFQMSIECGLSWNDLIQACHRYNTAMLPFQHTALKDIQKWCGDGSGQALFDTLFVFQRDVDSSKDSLWTIVDSEPVADYPLAFEAQLNSDDSLSLTIVGQPEYITQDMAEELLEKVERSLRALQKPGDEVPVFETKRSRRFSRRMSERERHRSDVPEELSSGFKWTKEATIIKKQIETLSNSEDVSEDISLFELGLDSIDIIKISSRLKKLGINLSVSSIIRGQTIKGMTAQIAAIQPTDTKATVSIATYEQQLMKYLEDRNLLHHDTLSVLPATPLQEGMIAEMIASDYNRYFNHEVYRIADDTDPERLRLAWTKVAEQHEILRTTFVEIDAVDLSISYAQVITNRVLGFDVISVDNVDLESVISQQIKQATKDAREGRLFSLKQFEVAHQNYFVLSISHALYDGFSLQALHNDVLKAYEGQEVARPDPRRILGRILSQDGPEAVKYWKTALGGLPNTHLQLRTEASEEVHRYEKQSSQSYSTIQNFCRKNAVSLQTLAQTCWAFLLASYQGSLDVAFGEVLSCRESDEANELMFPLMNTVAVRSVMHGTLLEMLHYMQENSNEMRQFEHFPLRKAQALAGPREGGLFDTLFIYQGRQNAPVDERKTLYEARSSVSEVEFPICIEIEIVGNELVWRTACKDIAKSHAETRSLVDNLDKILQTIMSTPQEQTIKSVKGGLSICNLPPFVDKTAPDLPVEQRSRDGSVESRDVPWTDTELMVRKVLSQVSQIEEQAIDRDQTIFHLGLDSISAIKVSSILRRQGINLKVQAIMQNNTIRKMGEHLRGIGATTEKQRDDTAILQRVINQFDLDAQLKLADIDSSTVEELLPVSAGQRYMLSRWQVSGGTAFTANFEYKVNGTDQDKLIKAWTTLVKEHSILRTMFLSIPNPVLPYAQVVLKKKASPIRWNTNSNQYATGAATQEADITLLDTSFLAATVKDGSTILNVHLHHALYDAISLPLLMQDLERLLQNTNERKSPPRLGKFIARGLDADDASYARRRNFWQNYLGKSDAELTPSTSLQRSETFRPSIQVGNIAKIAQSKGFSVDTILLAAFSKCYTSFSARQSRPSQRVIGLYLSNRAEDPQLIAPTLNLLPLRIEQGSLDDTARSFQDAIRNISDPLSMNTSLAEIYEWTGIQVNCFVNIWKSVSVDEDQIPPNSPDAKTTQDFSIENSNHEAIMRSERAEIVNIKPNPDIETGASEAMKKAYLPSIDCELKLWGDGGLDVGIFAPSDMMSCKEAREFIEEFCTLLRGL